MSRERTDTAESSNSFGLRDRSGTAGSAEFVAMAEARGPSNTYRDSQVSQRGRTAATAVSSMPSPSSSSGTSPISEPTILHRAVDWLQRQPVPKVLLPTVRRLLKLRFPTSSQSTSSSSSVNPNEPDPLLSDSPGRSANSNNDTTMIYCIRGLDRVVFGTTAAADCVVLLGIQPPRYLWYMVSGAICDIFQLIVDITLHLTIFPEDSQAALCWMASFCLSIIARHTSHRYLVFGDYVPNYWQSLGRMYAGYSISIVLSTIFNYVITEGVAKVSHYIAYVFTLLWTGLANYFILKRLWKMGGGPDKSTINGSSAGSPPGISSPPGGGGGATK